MSEKETWLDRWEAARELWLDADQPSGEFVTSSTKILKVRSKKPWRITGLTFKGWDKSMPIPVADMLLGLTSQMRIRLEMVIRHTAHTGEPWPTSIAFEANEEFTLAPIQHYTHCEMIVQVHWDRTATGISSREIYDQIGAPGIA